MILGKLIAIFVFVPIFELFILLEIGKRIGITMTIVIVIVTGVIGAYLVKKQGFYILFSIKNKMNEGIIPTDSFLEGLLVLMGGILLITPGIITDMTGFLLIIPQSRFIIFKYVKEWLIHQIKKQDIDYKINMY